MKYLGSKSRIVGEILPIMLKEMNGRNAFVDAFCGGCSVIQNVPPKYYRIANDKQKYLISMWKSLVDGKEFPQRIERDYYNKVRDCYNGKNNDYEDDLVGWTGFMGSYNGRFYDGGYSGHAVPTKPSLKQSSTNVEDNDSLEDMRKKLGNTDQPIPFGELNKRLSTPQPKNKEEVKTRDYIQENIKNIMKQVPYLKGVDFQSGDYWEIKMPDHSLIYCDIPYRDTKQYATSKGFDYEKFYEWCRQMTRKGHKVFVSEYWMPEDFKCVWQKELTNSMHPTKTKKPIEKLFTL